VTLKGQLLAIIKSAAGPLSLQTLQAEMDRRGIEATAFESRQALWELIGENEVVLTADLGVEVAE